MQTLAASIVLLALRQAEAYSGYGNRTHSGCSNLAKELQGKLTNDLSMEMQRKQEQNYYGHPQQPPATRQPAIGPLLEKLQELAKACKDCKKNVEDSRLDTFGLSLAGNDLRHVAMLPEWYWGLKLAG